jgi:hypothetical protein
LTTLTEDPHAMFFPWQQMVIAQRFVAANVVRLPNK